MSSVPKDGSQRFLRTFSGLFIGRELFVQIQEDPEERDNRLSK